MNKGYQQTAKPGSAKKGYSNVSVVNTPTVKIKHDSPPTLPTIRFTENDLPQLKDWEVGGKYTLVLQVEQTSKNKGNDYDFPSDSNSKSMSANFKVLSVSEDTDNDSD